MKRRLLTIFSATLAFILVIGVTFILNSLELKHDLFVIEDFYGMFNYTLEFRRYEKNVLYTLDADSYGQLLYYIDTVSESSERLRKSMARAIGADAVEEFRRELESYRGLFVRGRQEGVFDEPAIRSRGKHLVDFTQRLLKEKRDQIHTTLQVTTFAFIGTTASAFVVLLLVFQFQVRTVLKRLGLLKEATKEVAIGNFAPIRETSNVRDEITGLIDAFNRMLAELELKQDQLLQSRKLAAIGTFSSGIAHELNNPLNNISLTADTLNEEYGDVLGEDALQLVDDIIKEADRAGNVVKHLLDFTRETAPAETLVDLKLVLRNTVRLVRNQLRLESITLEDFVPEDLPRIRGDAHRLEQVFLNLFMNSIHAMQEGGLIFIEGEIDPRGYLQINFGDTGAGIAPDALEHIFDPFYTTKPVGQGTGLGLSIVYGIIKDHRGYIEVSSKVKKGTTFSIFLPIVESELEARGGNV